MEARQLWRPLAQTFARRTQPQRTPTTTPQWICQRCTRTPRRHQTTSSQSSAPADDPLFKSIVDNPPQLIRHNRRHNPYGLALLFAIPATAFLLGCWQVKRLTWKSDLIAKFEDRLVREPLPLPPQIDPDAIKDFDYRRVYARGVLRHDQEMLIGPRIHDGQDGYLVVTPLERSAQYPGYKGNTTILVCRGWIAKDKALQSVRSGIAPAQSLPTGEIVVEGLLREPWVKNSFTPDNHPEKDAWYFPDVAQMAAHVGSQAVWVEETMKADLLVAYERESRGVPIGRPPEVNLRNNHTQYIFTWFSLSLATSIMLWMVVKKPTSNIRARVRRDTQW